MRDRRLLLGIAALAVVATTAVRHPTADIRFVTHDLRDPAPRRMQAAFDLGVIGVSVLYTWTVHRLAS